jgi:hypothetical protein
VADHTHPGRPSGRTVIEPTRVIGPLRTSRRLDDDDLFRPADPAPGLVPTKAFPPPSGSEDDTRELDLGLDQAGPAAEGAVPERHGKVHGRWWQGKRMHAVVAASIASGFVLAMVLMARIVIPASPTTPQAAATASAVATPAAATPTQAVASQAAQPNAAVVVLRQGDSGPEVSDLQSRLLRIPDVYPNGKVDGQYDSVLTEAVARFQLWYGIRGDEDGEYGDATRRDLESRTS